MNDVFSPPPNVPEIWIDGIAHFENAGGGTIRVWLFANEPGSQRDVKIALRGALENLPAIIEMLTLIATKKAIRSVGVRLGILN